uniref:Putative tail protein n=1 Tax=viral metagenome TaxID=1070528 RepID=A0A6M3JS03_9ZZZZ
MAASVTWEGMAEFRAALRATPEHLRDEAVGITANTAHTAAQEIVDEYPTVTGNLKDGVKTAQMTTGNYGAGYIVKSTAPHAHLYEFGTQARQTDLGANRGAMPAKHTVIQVAVRRRRQMHDELAAMLRREGFEVTGDAGG